MPLDDQKKSPTKGPKRCPKKPLWTVVRDAVVSALVRYAVTEGLEGLEEILDSSETMFDDLEVVESDETDEGHD